MSKSLLRATTTSSTMIAPAVLGAAHMGVIVFSGYVAYSKNPSPNSAVLADDPKQITPDSKSDNPELGKPDVPGMNLRVETESDTGGDLQQSTYKIALEPVEVSPCICVCVEYLLTFSGAGLM